MEYLIYISHTGSDDPVKKPASMTADLSLLKESVICALEGIQLQPAIIAYESLPQRFKQPVIVKLDYKNPYSVVKVNLVESYIQHSAILTDFFDTHKLSDGRNLPKEKRREYYANAIVLEAVGKLLTDKRAKRAAMGKKLKINWPELAEGIQELDRSKYPHNLPACPRRLEDKFNRYKNEGAVSLIHKNFLNANAARVDNGVKESLLAELLADPRNLDNVQVASFYNMMAEKMSWQKISPATVSVWREKLDLKIYPGRRGGVAFSNTKAMQVKRRAPSFPLYYWTMDGWEVELLYQQTEGTASYHHRPTVVVVLDACLKYPMGYAIGAHETPELIQEALRNAVKHTEELFGKMYRTQQSQSDRYAFKKMKPHYEGISERVTPARAKNAKAKVIEPFFGTNMNKKYCQLFPNWSGYGITSNKEKQPNMEFLNHYKKNFPDYEGVCKQIDMMIERERTCDGKQERFLELWNQMPEEHKVELTHENYLLLFGETTGFRNKLEGSGLNITIRGLKRHYDCFDLSFREHGSTAWEIRYDPDNLTHVLAVNEDETLRFMLEEKYIQPMALCERKDGDSDQLQRVRNYNKALEENIIDFRTKNAETIREASLELPEFSDTLKKLLITDSAGQHKDNRNRERMLRQAGRLNEKYEDAVQLEETNDFKEDRLNYLKKKVDLSQYIV